MLDHLDLSVNVSAEALGVLLILVALEAVLSADNAIALAAIAQGLESAKLQRRALNLGLLFAYILRITLIVTATWVIQFWQFELIGAAYLLWLVFNYFASPEEKKQVHHGLAFASVWQAIPMIALTDFAFSLDSVTAAIAVADETWLIIVGGTVGVITLRFLAGLFIRLLKEYTHLEDAGFITVGLVGIRLLFRVVNPEWNLPEWFMTATIVAIFIWGFSERTPKPLEEEEG
ncbi:MAG: TerC family protein [Cyanophyceae cyanobacterium]